jgi:hypothetical protein
MSTMAERWPLERKLTYIIGAVIVGLLCSGSLGAGLMSDTDSFPSTLGVLGVDQHAGATLPTNEVQP